MAGIKTLRWFKDNVSEDEDKLKSIGEIANRRLHDVMSMDLEDSITAIAIYGNIFETACRFVAAKEKDYDTFDLNIADFIHIGYTTTDSEDDEKNGNFMVYLQHVENQTIDAIIDEDENMTLALAAMWNAAHIKTQVEANKEVAVNSMGALKDFINFKTEAHEYIIPVFCIIHAQLIRYLKQQRIDLKVSDYEVNVAGLFTAGVSVNDDAEEEIYFTPSIALKLLFKNDSIASSSGDDD